MTTNKNDNQLDFFSMTDAEFDAWDRRDQELNIPTPGYSEPDYYDYITDDL